MKKHRLSLKQFADKNAATAIEFAIIAPILLLIVYGIICFGVYFGAVHGVQQLAAEAARRSIAGISDDERVRLAQAAIDTNAESYPFITPAHLTVRSASTDPSTDSFTLTLDYDASDMAIFKLPYVPRPPTSISRSATIQRGGY